MTHKIPCPECGRILNIPAGAGSKKIGCKGCLHLFSYDDQTGKLAPQGQIQPARPKKRLLALQIMAIILTGCALCAYILYDLPLSSSTPPAAEGDIGSVLRDVQKQLKSLAD